MTSLVSVRVPLKLKKAAQKVAAANGLDLSTCVRMLFTQMELRGALPMPLLTVNGLTEEEEEELLQRAREPLIAFDSVDKAMQTFRKR